MTQVVGYHGEDRITVTWGLVVSMAGYQKPIDLKRPASQLVKPHLSKWTTAQPLRSLYAGLVIVAPRIGAKPNITFNS